MYNSSVEGMSVFIASKLDMCLNMLLRPESRTACRMFNEVFGFILMYCSFYVCECVCVCVSWHCVVFSGSATQTIMFVLGKDLRENTGSNLPWCVKSQ